MTKLAVVILNWNGRKHLERYLPSVVKHTTAEGVEIVIADNGSTDDSILWLRMEYPELRVVRLDRNYGFAEGYNRALLQIEAEYYLLLNSDVEVTAGWWQPLVEVLDKSADVAVVAPKLLSDTQREICWCCGRFHRLLGLSILSWSHTLHGRARQWSV